MMAAAALALGGTLTMAPGANAAPADVVVFDDVNLENAVNDELGNPHGTPITEADAASVVELHAPSEGIRDLTGLEAMVGLTGLWLYGNSIRDFSPLSNLPALKQLDLSATGIGDLAPLAGLSTLEILSLFDNRRVDDLTPLSGLTSLAHLSLYNCSIEDVAPLSGLTGLEYLSLSKNSVADVLPLGSLASLTRLDLADNSIADLSPIGALTGLTELKAFRQTVTPPPAAIGVPTPNPVIDALGNAVPVASVDQGFSYDAALNEWVFTETGTATMTWDSQITLANGTLVEFTGTISQRVRPAQVAPEDPVVQQATCMGPEVIDPMITLPDTTGIAYSIVGDVVPGNTVTIEAVPADDNHAIYVDPASDWVDRSGDHIYATLEITLDAIDCSDEPIVIDAPNGDLPVDDKCGPDNATWILPAGDDAPVGFTWMVEEDGLLIAVADDGYAFNDPTGELGTEIREYGYAPDTGEPCPTDPEDPIETDDPIDADDPIVAPDPVVTGDPTLPKTGGEASLTVAGAALSLLALGGFLLTTRRKAHND